MNAAPSDSRWSPGRIVALTGGSLAALIGTVLLLVGVVLVVAHSEGRDGDGYYTTGTERLSTATRALTVEDVDLGTGAADVLPKDVLGRVRVRAERPDGRPIFLGIAAEADVDAYLRDVAHAEVDDLDPARYLTRRGGAAPQPPSSQGFWVASAEGPGRQAVDWEVEGGRWAVVAMNADGTPRVALDADVGAKVGWLLGVGIGLLVVGLLLVAGAVVLIVVAVRRASGV